MGIHHRRKRKIFSQSKHSCEIGIDSNSSVTSNIHDQKINTSMPIGIDKKNNTITNYFNDDEIISDFSSQSYSHSDTDSSNLDAEETPQETSFRLANDILRKYELDENSTYSHHGLKFRSVDKRFDILPSKMKRHEMHDLGHQLPLSHLINPDMLKIHSRLHSVPTCISTNNSVSSNTSDLSNVYVSLKDGSILKYALDKCPHPTNYIYGLKPIILIDKYNPNLRKTFIYKTKPPNNKDYNPHDTSVMYSRNMRSVLGLCVTSSTEDMKNSDTLICVGTGDGFVRVYRECSLNKKGTYPKIELLIEWRKHKGPVVCLQCRNMELFSGSTDRLIHHYTLSTFGYIQTLYGHQHSLSCLQTTPLLLSTSHDRTIRIWNTHTQSHLIFRSVRHILCVCGLSEYWFATGSACGVVGLWHIKRKKVFDEYVIIENESWPNSGLNNREDFTVNGPDKEPYRSIVQGINFNKGIKSTTCLYKSPITALKHHSDLLIVGSKNSLLFYRVQVEELSDIATRAHGRLQKLSTINIRGYINDIVIINRWCVVAVGREMRDGRWDVVKGGKNSVCWIEMWKKKNKINKCQVEKT